MLSKCYSKRQPRQRRKLTKKPRRKRNKSSLHHPHPQCRWGCKSRKIRWPPCSKWADVRFNLFKITKNVFTNPISSSGRYDGSTWTLRGNDGSLRWWSHDDDAPTRDVRRHDARTRGRDDAQLWNGWYDATNYDAADDATIWRPRYVNEIVRNDNRQDMVCRLDKA